MSARDDYCTCRGGDSDLCPTCQAAEIADTEHPSDAQLDALARAIRTEGAA